MEEIVPASVFSPESEDFYDSFYCEKCHCLLKQPCWLHTTIIKDENVVPLSIASLPDVLYFGGAENEKGVFAKTSIRPHTVFGPLVAPPLHPSEISARTLQDSLVPCKTLAFNMDNDKWCNWMKHVTVVRNDDERNLKIYLLGEDVIFVSVKVIAPGEELKVAVGYNWTMRTSGSCSRRMTFGDMENAHFEPTRRGIQDNNPLPVFAVDSRSPILTKTEGWSSIHIELLACAKEEDENGLPNAACNARENDSQCALSKDESFSDFDVSRTVLPPLDLGCESHSSVPSLPVSATEECPTLCSALSSSLQHRDDRESSPEYPFPPIHQLNLSTMIPQCQQHENVVDCLPHSPQKIDSRTRCEASLPVSESADDQQKVKKEPTAEGAIDEKESHKNSCIIGATVCDKSDKVFARSYSLRPRIAKTAVAYNGHSEKREADEAADDDMIDDSDVDADWLVSDTERESSTDSEECLDYAFASPTKKSKPSHSRFEEDTKIPDKMEAPLTIPMIQIAPPFIGVDNTDIEDNLDKAVAIAATVDTMEASAAIRPRFDADGGYRNTPSDMYRFKCPECSLHFRHDLLLQWHRQFQHSATVDEPWVPRRKCAVCRRVSTTDQTMMRHVEQHGVAPNRIKHFVPTGDPNIMRYVADGGGSVVVSDEFPVDHTTHVLCFMYSAEECFMRGCTLRFCSEALRDIHKLKHAAPKKYEGTLVCPACRFEADNPRTLFEHVGQHGAARDDRKMCWRCAEFVVNMNKHAACMHKKEYEELMSTVWPYACDQCEQRCRTNALLNGHRGQAHGARMPQCYICAKQFPNSRLLKQHSDEHRTDEGLVCPTCQKSFQSYREFSLHTKRHAVKRVSICGICQAVFASRLHLLMHEKVHGTDYKYNCDQCDKSFKRPGNLSQHKNCVHSDMYRKRRKERKEEMQKKGIVVKYVCPRKTMRYEDYPFKCEECRLGWLKLGALEQHKTRKHPVSGLDT